MIRMKSFRISDINQFRFDSEKRVAAFRNLDAGTLEEFQKRVSFFHEAYLREDSWSVRRKRI
ncbi:MAG: hypothetical protein AAF368_08645, partial [Planctomycetota bacterium]